MVVIVHYLHGNPVHTEAYFTLTHEKVLAMWILGVSL